MSCSADDHAILVAVDGSPESDAAVASSAGEAALRHLPVALMHVVVPVVASYPPSGRDCRMATRQRGMTEEQMYDMYRRLALAKYEERYVIPSAYVNQGHQLEETATECVLSFDGGPGMYESGPFGEASGGPVQCHVAAGVVAQSHRGNIPVGAPRSSPFSRLTRDGCSAMAARPHTFRCAR